MARENLKPMRDTPSTTLEAHELVYRVEAARLLDQVSLSAGPAGRGARLERSG